MPEAALHAKEYKCQFGCRLWKNDVPGRSILALIDLAADTLTSVPNARKSVHWKTNRRRFFLTRGDYEWPEQILKRQVAGSGAVSVRRPRLSVAYGRILTLEAATDLEPYLLDSLGA